MTGHRNNSGIIVIGRGLVGLVSDAPLAETSQYRREALGNALVTAVSTSRMGIETAFVTRIGSDPHTNWLLSVWDDEHLHLDHVQRGKGTNNLLIVGPDDEFVPFADGSSAVSLHESDVEHLPWTMSVLGYASGALHHGEESAHPVVIRAFSDARRHGVRTVYNPSLHPSRWSLESPHGVRNAFLEIVEHVDVLILKAPYGSAQLLDEASAEDAAAAGLNLGVHQVIVRDPSGGCVVATPHGTHILAGHGRGLHAAMDGTFDGILLAGLARGLTIEDAARTTLEILGTHFTSVGQGYVGLQGIPSDWLDDYT